MRIVGPSFCSLSSSTVKKPHVKFCPLGPSKLEQFVSSKDGWNSIAIGAGVGVFVGTAVGRGEAVAVGGTVGTAVGIGVEVGATIGAVVAVGTVIVMRGGCVGSGEGVPRLQATANSRTAIPKMENKPLPCPTNSFLPLIT